MELTNEQNKVIDEILHQMVLSGYGWRPWSADIFNTTVAGYAGTGKTTLIAELRKKISNEFKKVSVAFITFTGKASSVLKKKLIEQDAYFEDDYCGTIHGLIYIPETKYDPQLKCQVIVGWKKREQEDLYHHILIIDEASMISEQIWNDLKYYEKTIISVGDHGQLPPIGPKFNLLTKPDFVLKTIHRQALNSPIIRLSQFVRYNGFIPSNTFFSKEVFKLDWNSNIAQQIWNNKIDFYDDLIVLCAFNTTRSAINDIVRKRLDFNDILPFPGEKLVCLQNNHSIKIMNGQIGELMWVMPMDYGLHRMTISIDGEMYECLVSPKCFGEVTYTMHDLSKKLKQQREYGRDNGFSNIDFFDYGYCISVHKSQGSEWEKVVLFEQRTKRWDDEYYARWLYTAVTRAKEKLFIISNAWL